MPGGGPYTTWEKCCFLIGITVMVVCCIVVAPVTLVAQWVLERFGPKDRGPGESEG